jgi:pilus assembly protein Flp/PilA
MNEQSEEQMRALLRRLWTDEEGQDLVEYGLLVALVALAAIAGMQTLASAINTTFTSIGTQVTNLTGT